MRQESIAYPGSAQQVYLKWIVVGAVALFALFLFMSNVDDVPPEVRTTTFGTQVRRIAAVGGRGRACGGR